VTGFVTAALAREHDRIAFSSGVDILDRYLRELAFQDIKRRIAGCFVALDDAGSIAGYYTLAATHIPLNSLPTDVTKKLPRYPVVPAMLIGRLAVATRHQQQGLGRALTADAAIRTAGFKIGAFALVVDVRDERSVSFYQSTGFTLFPDETRRLFQPMETALRSG